MRRRTTNSTPAADSWQTALRLLSRRDYAVEELRQKLLAKGCSAEDAERAVARGVALGYLDDARHVERLSRSLLAGGRAAGPRLLLELRRRGLPEELIRAAVAETRGDPEDQALRVLVARRFPAFSYLAADARERRRVIDFLLRRGFPLDRILTELKRTDS